MNPSNPSSRGKIGTRHEPAKPANHERKGSQMAQMAHPSLCAERARNTPIAPRTRNRAAEVPMRTLKRYIGQQV